jgi:hypothetical protein
MLTLKYGSGGKRGKTAKAQWRKKMAAAPVTGGDRQSVA